MVALKAAQREEAAQGKTMQKYHAQRCLLACALAVAAPAHVPYPFAAWLPSSVEVQRLHPRHRPQKQRSPDMLRQEAVQGRHRPVDAQQFPGFVPTCPVRSSMHPRQAVGTHTFGFPMLLQRGGQSHPTRSCSRWTAPSSPRVVIKKLARSMRHRCESRSCRGQPLRSHLSVGHPKMRARTGAHLRHMPSGERASAVASRAHLEGHYRNGSRAVARAPSSLRVALRPAPTTRQRRGQFRP